LGVSGSSKHGSEHGAVGSVAVLCEWPTESTLVRSMPTGDQQPRIPIGSTTSKQAAARRIQDATWTAFTTAGVGSVAKLSAPIRVALVSKLRAGRALRPDRPCTLRRPYRAASSETEVSERRNRCRRGVRNSNASGGFCWRDEQAVSFERHCSQSRSRLPAAGVTSTTLGRVARGHAPSPRDTRLGSTR